MAEFRKKSILLNSHLTHHLEQRQNDMGDKECKESNENARNHVEMDIFAISQQQNTDQATNQAHRQFAQE